MLSLRQDVFLKNKDIIFHRDEIAYIDCSMLEQLKIVIHLRCGKEIYLEDILALELLMQLKPSILEGKKLKWPKFVWCIHNLIAHPLMQMLALLKCYKVAFWIHEITVPKPIGKKP